MMVGSFDRLRPFSTAESSSPASSPKRTRPSPTRKPPTSSTTSRNLVGLIPTVSAADRQQEEKKKEQLGMATYSIFAYNKAAHYCSKSLFWIWTIKNRMKKRTWPYLRQTSCYQRRWGFVCRHRSPHQQHQVIWSKRFAHRPCAG